MKFANGSVILSICVLGICGAAFASGYPADYGHQRAYFTTDGPVVFGCVSSGVMPVQYVIGYKKSGPLGGQHDLDVLIRVHVRGGKVVERRHVLTREWNDTGLLSGGLAGYYLSPDYFSGAVPEKIELAFFKQGQWDSKYGQNYVFAVRDLHTGTSFPVRSFVGTEAEGDISLSVWNFIVGLMRE